MKYHVIVWADGVDEENPLSTTATVHANSALEAIKKVVKDIEKLEEVGE